MRRLGLVLLCAGLAVVLGPRASWACTCEGASDEQLFRAAPLVFAGVVTDRDEVLPDPSDDAATSAHGRSVWTFDVESVQKGPAGEIQRIRSASEEACGFDFEVGGRYQVFGTPGDPGGTSLCSGTRTLAAGDMPYRPDPPTALIVGAVLGALALVWSFRRIRDTRMEIDPGSPHPMD